MQTRHFTLTDLAVVILILMIIIVMIGMLFPMHPSREEARRANCAGNLKQIGLALLMYSGDYGGEFPSATARGSNDFEPLNTLDVLNDGKVYACPTARQSLTLARNSNFRYRGSGLTDDNDSANTITIAYDMSGNHPDNQWMNALFIDGHAEGARPNGTKQPNGWNVTQ